MVSFGGLGCLMISPGRETAALHDNKLNKLDNCPFFYDVFFSFLEDDSAA